MPRRVLEGSVVSNKANKTITVSVERRYMHPIYKKYVKRSDKYAAHDENNTYQVGDRVQIIECRPISKSKRWTVLEGGAEAKKASKTHNEVKVEKKPEAKKADAPKKEKAAEAKKPAAAAKKPAAKKKKD